MNPYGLTNRKLHLKPCRRCQVRMAPTLGPQTVCLALGRLFAMMHRPAQAGDVEMYYMIRDIVMAGIEPPVDHAPNWARDRLNGAQGD